MPNNREREDAILMWCTVAVATSIVVFVLGFIYLIVTTGNGLS